MGRYLLECNVHRDDCSIPGYIFSDVSDLAKGSTAGLVPVLVMVVSAFVMILSGLAVKKLKYHWISDYALPVSLVLGMASAIPITAWLG